MTPTQKPLYISGLFSAVHEARQREMGVVTPLFDGDPDFLSYLDTELAIRSGEYCRVENHLHRDVSPRVRKFCIAYRDLFTAPEKALKSVNELLTEGELSTDIETRLLYWKAHLLLLTGSIREGDTLFRKIEKAEHVPSIWKSEFMALIALGHYLAGRPDKALEGHYACQSLLDQDDSWDRFTQTFNSAMAARTALKLADGSAFEFFSTKLEESLGVRDDLRYRLRHTGYRAMILNQMGENEVAEKYWGEGDALLRHTESTLEKSQFLIFRGLSHALMARQAEADAAFERADEELARVGTLPLYAAELEVARVLGPVAHPSYRGNALMKSIEATGEALERLAELEAKAEGHLATIYREAIDFARAILEGHPIPPPRHSLVVSILQNIATKGAYASTISHFRLVPSFFNNLVEEKMDLSQPSLQSAIKRTLGVGPVATPAGFGLSSELAHVARQPEVENLLKIASSLLQVSRLTDELRASQAHMRDLERAAFLVHDLKFFATELRKLGSKDGTAARLSHHFSGLIDGFQKSIRSGASPASPTLIDLENLLREVAATAEEMTGKRCCVKATHRPAFVWQPEPILRRIFENLVKNALEASPTDKPTQVTISNGRSGFVVHVKDAGSGLRKEVFEAARAGKVKTTKSGGSGIGLRSAFECAQSLSAELKLHSSGPGGTTVAVQLRRGGDALDLSGVVPRLIVIDDSAAVLEAWKSFGESSGIPLWALEPRNIPLHGVELPESVEWIVVDYDLKQPSLDGLALARIFREAGKKIALSSGFENGELPDEVIGFGFDAVIGKEPQLPEQRPPVLAIDKAASRTDSTRKFRHDIRNRLTPIKEAYRHLSRKSASTAMDKKALTLIGTHLHALEETLSDWARTSRKNHV